MKTDIDKFFLCQFIIHIKYGDCLSLRKKEVITLVKTSGDRRLFKSKSKWLQVLTSTQNINLQLIWNHSNIKIKLCDHFFHHLKTMSKLRRSYFEEVSTASIWNNEHIETDNVSVYYKN